MRGDLRTVTVAQVTMTTLGARALGGTAAGKPLPIEERFGDATQEGGGAPSTAVPLLPTQCDVWADAGGEALFSLQCNLTPTLQFTRFFNASGADGGWRK